MNVSVVGLGKLGSCLAAVLADQGHRVFGIDTDPNSVNKMNNHIAPVEEPGLQQLIIKNCERLSATTDYGAIVDSDYTFVIVPTPSDRTGVFFDGYVKDACFRIAGILNEADKPFHNIVIVSTVFPGTMEKLALIFQGITTHWNLMYNPEFIALGDVINGLKYPDFVLIGGNDRAAMAELVANFYQGKKIQRMNWINAEIAKLALNVYVTMKISFANNLAQICEAILDADANIITEAIGQDSRIGEKYIKPGLGFGGPCFPRDGVAFERLAESVAVDAPLARATRNINYIRTQEIAEIIIRLHQPGMGVGVLGLTYKPNTPVTEKSQAVDIIERLHSHNIDVTVYDPTAKRFGAWPDGTTVVKTMYEVLAMADILVVATAWDHFHSIRPEWLKHHNVRIIDCWGIMPFSEGVIIPGRGPKEL